MSAQNHHTLCHLFLQLGDAVVFHHRSILDRPFAHIEHLGSGLLPQICGTCGMLIVARLEVCQLRRDPSPLTLAEVPPLEVERHDEADRIGTIIAPHR